MESKCPFCESASVEAVASDDLLAGHGYRGKCMTCGATGPQVGASFWAVENFTHPAHLMEGLHTFDPATEVVIKREDVLKIYDGNCGDCMIGLRKNPPCAGCCMAPIHTAALEAKP